MAQFRQPVLIYNPAAGRIRRNPDAILQATKAALARAGWQVALRPTSGPNQAAELARQAVAEGADLVLVLGGDGTINEVIQGMVHTGVPVGILPGGTANCLAMELGLGKKISRAAERLAQSDVIPVTLGRLCGTSVAPRYFALMCGAGLDAAIVDEVIPGLKKAAGKLAYWVAGLSQFRRMVAPLEIRLDGRSHACGFVLASRIRNYGGDLEICNQASLRAADFEVVWFEGSNPLRYAIYMLGVAVRQVKRLPGVHVARATSLEILSNAPSQIDGEFVGREALRIEVVPDALRLLVPSSYR